MAVGASSGGTPAVELAPAAAERLGEPPSGLGVASLELARCRWLDLVTGAAMGKRVGGRCSGLLFVGQRVQHGRCIVIHLAQVGLAEAQQINAARKPNSSLAHPTQREAQSTQKTSPMGEGWLSLLKWLPPLKLNKVGLF
jgi:hypothetical protein